ncbi:MAG: DUF2285 domain-containing protein [Novosphingobium sp.]
MAKVNFLAEPPQGDGLTGYDEQHLVTYLRLLDAEAEGADWREVVRIVFEIEPDADPKHAKVVFTSHLARAHWVRDSGFRHLLDKQ